MRRLVPAIVVLVLVAVGLFACARPRFPAGEACEVNSDCDAPLVCAVGACRRQCVDSRDCGAGLRCLIVDPALGGGCQVDREAICSLNSDCRELAGAADLVCQNGTCTTPCREDRDCAAGARCIEDDDHVLGCYEDVVELCIYNTDCPDPMVCGRDQLCHLECLDDRDCTAPRVCSDRNLCELPDGG